MTLSRFAYARQHTYLFAGGQVAGGARCKAWHSQLDSHSCRDQGPIWEIMPSQVSTSVILCDVRPMRFTGEPVRDLCLLFRAVVPVDTIFSVLYMVVP